MGLPSARASAIGAVTAGLAALVVAEFVQADRVTRAAVYVLITAATILTIRALFTDAREARTKTTIVGPIAVGALFLLLAAVDPLDEQLKAATVAAGGGVICAALWLSGSERRLLRGLTYLAADALFFAAFYLQGVHQGNLRITGVPPDEFGIAQALYLSVGTLSTAGTGGLAPEPAHAPTLLWLAAQMATFVVIVYWSFRGGPSNAERLGDGRLGSSAPPGGTHARVINTGDAQRLEFIVRTAERLLDNEDERGNTIERKAIAIVSGLGVTGAFALQAGVFLLGQTAPLRFATLALIAYVLTIGTLVFAVVLGLQAAGVGYFSRPSPRDLVDYQDTSTRRLRQEIASSTLESLRRNSLSNDDRATLLSWAQTAFSVGVVSLLLLALVIAAEVWSRSG
jgi:hypothetical protein